MLDYSSKQLLLFGLLFEGSANTNTSIFPGPFSDDDLDDSFLDGDHPECWIAMLGFP